MGTGDIPPFIRNLSIGWRWVVSFTPWTLYRRRILLRVSAVLTCLAHLHYRLQVANGKREDSELNGIKHPPNLVFGYFLNDAALIWSCRSLQNSRWRGICRNKLGL